MGSRCASTISAGRSTAVGHSTHELHSGRFLRHCHDLNFGPLVGANGETAFSLEPSVGMHRAKLN